MKTKQKFGGKPQRFGQDQGSGGKGIDKIRKGYKKGLDTLFSRGQSTYRSDKQQIATAKHFSEVNAA
jgi:hypothetical protein